MYKCLPIYMGATVRNLKTDAPTLEMMGIWKIHLNITSMTAINGDANYVTAPSVITNSERNFLDVSIAFNPLKGSQGEIGPLVDT